MWHHPGKAFCDEDAFEDWDESCHGRMDTKANRREYPECFLWNCCGCTLTSRGCVARVPGALVDWAALFFVLLGFVYVSVRLIEPREFAYLFNPADFLANPWAGFGSGARKIWTTTNLVLMLVNSLAIGFVVAMTDRSSEVLGKVAELLGFQMPIDPVVWLTFLFFVLGVLYYVLKFVAIQFAGSLFDLDRMATPHFYEFLRLSTFLSLVLLCATAFAYGSYLFPASELWTVVAVATTIVFIIRMLKIGLLLNSVSHYSLLYLFTYLCLTEVIPMTFMLKFVLPTA
jgi:hypothetical protein